MDCWWVLQPCWAHFRLCCSRELKQIIGTECNSGMPIWWPCSSIDNVVSLHIPGRYCLSAILSQRITVHHFHDMFAAPLTGLYILSLDPIQQQFHFLFASICSIYIWYLRTHVEYNFCNSISLLPYKIQRHNFCKYVIKINSQKQHNIAYTIGNIPWTHHCTIKWTVPYRCALHGNVFIYAVINFHYVHFQPWNYVQVHVTVPVCILRAGTSNYIPQKP